MQFSAPATGGSGISISDLDGHLLVVEPLEHRAEIVTSNGPRDAIRATVHDITTNTTHEDMLIFPKVLVGSLKGRIGQRVLATLGKGAAKPGQNAPWVLVDMSGDPGSVNDATRYLTERTSSTIAAPAQPADTGIELTPELLAALGNLTGKQ
jgi:hypothetical protein